MAVAWYSGHVMAAAAARASPGLPAATAASAMAPGAHPIAH